MFTQLKEKLIAMLPTADIGNTDNPADDKVRNHYAQQTMRAATNAAYGSDPWLAPSVSDDVHVVIHRTANGHTITIRSDMHTTKEWVCPEGTSVIDVIAAALAEFALTK